MAKAEFELPITPERAEVFTHWFPDAQVATTSTEAVPSAALEVFEYRSSCFIDPETYKPLNFTALYLITHKDGGRTFAARQTKVLPGGPEESTYFVDVNENNEYLGYSELRYVYDNPKTFFKEKLFEQYSETKKGFTRHGLSTRRIYARMPYPKCSMDYPCIRVHTLYMTMTSRVKESNPKRWFGENL